MFHVPERFRVKDGPMGSTSEYGNNGYFIIPLDGDVGAHVIASDGLGWDHISIHCEDPIGHDFTPDWDIMCKLKDMFWGEEDTVIQLHPPRSHYVNDHPNTLHLWRMQGWDDYGILPPQILV